jgi:hypothetical protein
MPSQAHYFNNAVHSNCHALVPNPADPVPNEQSVLSTRLGRASHEELGLIPFMSLTLPPTLACLVDDGLFSDYPSDPVTSSRAGSPGGVILQGFDPRCYRSCLGARIDSVTWHARVADSRIRQCGNGSPASGTIRSLH